MTTAASRPGGKFAKSGTAASRPGGKFAARGKTSLTSSNPEGSKDPSSGTNTTAPQITKETLIAKRSKLKRHGVFGDLDNAERLVMDILSIATSTSEAFSGLAQSTQIVASEENGEDETLKQNGRQLQHRIRKNGQEYLSKIKKIHDLLAPHASLVKSYGNLQESIEKKTSDLPTSTAADSTTEKVEGVTSMKNNMYVSRLEMRFAIERKNLLREMVRLEEAEVSSDEENEPSVVIKNETVPNDNTSSLNAKRKREDL